MVEILLSLVLLVAAAALALWPWVGIHDHTIDGLYPNSNGVRYVPAIPVHFHLATALARCRREDSHS
jgi:hypothetical protein